jgi:hypothetical protein
MRITNIVIGLNAASLLKCLLIHQRRMKPLLNNVLTFSVFNTIATVLNANIFSGTSGNFLR